MLNWDDVRYFLAVSRSGSVRGAAEKLQVNHTTVLRRIAQLEDRLGARMFKKLPSGYRLTDAGEQVQEFAEQMETSSHQLEKRVLGQDQGLRGILRVTMAPTVATHLLMPDLAEFSRVHPDIEMEILSTLERVNLTNREADVAVRVVHDRNTLPANLHGVKGPDLNSGVYIARELLDAWRKGKTGQLRWVSKTSIGMPEWSRTGEVPIDGSPFRVPEDEAHIEALRRGIGAGALPCFVGDAEDQLIRIPGSRLAPHGTFWLLTHGETRKTKRVRLFIEFMRARLSSYAELLSGKDND